MIVHADAETRSPVNLKTQGAHVYFEHPDTEVLMLAWRLDNDILQLWERGQPCPLLLAIALAEGATVIAHNAAFEYLALRWLHQHRGWPQLSLDQFRDTAAMAAAMALPRKLENLANVLALPVRKDKEGTRLINKFSKPRRLKRPGLHWNEPEDHPDDWKRFGDYCRQDVLTEEAAERRLIPLCDAEQELWLLHELINQRGIRIDRASIEAALALAEKAKGAFDAEMALVTGDMVKRCSDAAALARWVKLQGVDMDSVAKAEIVDALDSSLDLPAPVRRALVLRQQAAKTSVSKLQTILARANSDDRVRGTVIYHGASTGRSTSIGVNFYNLPRPRKIFEEAAIQPAVLFDAIRQRDPTLLRFLFGETIGNPLHLLADAIRGFVWAAPGHDLIVADYSGIEGAVIAWLSGEQWKLQAFHEIIADPSKPDMYRRTAAAIMNMPVDEIGKKHPLRQSVGKVSELALGFGGGVGAFASMAKQYQVDLVPLYEAVYANSDPLIIDAAEARYRACLSRKERSTDLLGPKAWLACELIKRNWRETNAAIRQSWWDLEEGVREAVHNPGTIVNAANVAYRVAHNFLFARLPSGRCLAYAKPRLRPQVYASRLIDGVWAEPEVMEREIAEKLETVGQAKIKSKSFPKVTALGVNGMTRKWERFALYGGLLAENNTQAVARDLMVNGMWQAETAGYPVVLTIYDEIVTEVPRGFGDVGAFERLICELPAWAKGMPLSAGGYRAKRYRKG